MDISTYIDDLADNAGGENGQSSGQEGLVEEHFVFVYVPLGRWTMVGVWLYGCKMLCFLIKCSIASGECPWRGFKYYWRGGRFSLHVAYRFDSVGQLESIFGYALISFVDPDNCSEPSGELDAGSLILFLWIWVGDRQLGLRLSVHSICLALYGDYWGHTS